MEEPLAITGLPSFVYYDYAIDIHLRIYQKGSWYEAEISAEGGQTQRVPIEMSSDDLVSLNKLFQEEIAKVTSEDLENWTLGSTESESRLRHLCDIGRYAYHNRIFNNRDARTTIQDALAVTHKRRISGRSIHIRITSEDFFLPWELIYPDDTGQQLSYKHFWGMNYVISRDIVQAGHSGAYSSTVISGAPKPRLGLLTYCHLPCVVEKEIPFFEKLDKEGKIALFKLRALDPDRKEEELEVFKKFWKTSFDLVHFACHAVHDKKIPAKSYLLLSDEFPIELWQLQAQKVRFSGHPLIILNACKTGNPDPRYTSYFAGVFRECGSRGVVATECAVSDAFAAKFTEQLYTYLLEGKTLGDSLLMTRRYFLEEFHNPLGLLYSMYASPSIRLAKTGE